MAITSNELLEEVLWETLKGHGERIWQGSQLRIEVGPEALAPLAAAARKEILRQIDLDRQGAEGARS